MILENKLNITNQIELAKAEEKISNRRDGFTGISPKVWRGDKMARHNYTITPWIVRIGGLGRFVALAHNLANAGHSDQNHNGIRLSKRWNIHPTLSDRQCAHRQHYHHYRSHPITAGRVPV